MGAQWRRGEPVNLLVLRLLPCLGRFSKTSCHYSVFLDDNSPRVKDSLVHLINMMCPVSLAANCLPIVPKMVSRPVTDIPDMLTHFLTVCRSGLRWSVRRRHPRTLPVAGPVRV